MSISPAEQRTIRFYDWELRCRGWDCYSVPVELEPTFVPFTFTPTLQQIDDGIRPTLLTHLADFIAGKKKPPPHQPEEIDYDTIDPIVFNNDSPLQVIGVSIPKQRKIEPAEVEQLLCMLSYSKAPISFEIIASHTLITIQIVCRDIDYRHVYGQIKAYFPDFILNESDDAMQTLLEETSNHMHIVDFGLAEEFVRPIATSQSFKIDPYIGLFGVLDNLNQNEFITIQALFQGTLNPWAENIMRAVTDHDGTSFFSDAPEMLDCAIEKISAPLFGVTLRIATVAPHEHTARIILENASLALSHLSGSTTNLLVPLVTDAFSFELRFQDILLRESHRSGMILNSKELATVAHFPSESVVSYKLRKETKKTKQAPGVAQGHQLILGANIHQGKEVLASVSDSQRLKHTHVIGATGTGKSTFLLNLITQDIRNGQGIAVLDPHGDLIEAILPHIPEDRYKDVMIIDPSDAEFPVGFNILSAHSEIEKDILSSDLVAAFRRLSTSWGDQMNSVLANAILAFLESNTGGTLVDLRRFLVEKPFRDTFLLSVQDPSIIYYWQKEYPLLKSNSIGSILTRLDTFLRPKLIRNMVAQSKGPDFEQILDTKKILLVKLSQGLIGTENSYLLGTFIVSKIHQAAMARQAKRKDLRSDYFVYIDEFQNFITPSMSSILSGARKYHLGLILAHQDMLQLSKYDTELASSVSSNASTRVCFRLGDIDARRFENTFSSFDSHDLQNLETGEAIVKIDRPEFDFNITTLPMSEIDQDEIERVSIEVLSESRKQYGTPKQEVENFLKTIHGVETSILIEQKNEVSKEKPVIKEITKIPVETINEEVKGPVEKKEQSQHRYLQTLIKKMAEARGYISSIEKPLPNGGRVDVALERNGKKIACEISVTTSDSWEVHNIQKCLDAGYDLVIECSSEAKTLNSIQMLVNQSLVDTVKDKVLFYEPTDLFHFLDSEIVKDASTESLVKGYRVKVEYSNVEESTKKQKRDNILKVITESIKKKNK